MTSNTELRRVVKGDEDSLYRAINVLIDRDRGNIGSQVRYRDYNGKRQLVVGSGGTAAGAALSSGNYSIDVQSPIGFHIAALLSGTSPTAAPTVANTALLVRDAALSTAVDFLTLGDLKWMSSTNFVLTLSHNATADHVVTFQDLAGTAALLGAQNAGHLLWIDNQFDIGAAGTNRPRDVYIARNLIVGGSVTSGGVGVTSTWTPELASTGATLYTTQSGTYTKFDNVVMIRCTLTLNGAKDAGASAQRISGLPFVVGALPSAAAVAFWANSTTNYASVTAQFVNATSSIDLYATPAAGAASEVNAVFFGTSSSIQLSGFYFV